MLLIKQIKRISIVSIWGFGIKCNFKRLINSKKVTSMQVFQVMEFLASLCIHAMEKSPHQSLFTSCLKCLSPNFMVESSRSCKLIFEKTLEKLVSYKQLPSREETDCVNTFICQFCLDTSKFVIVRKELKMFVILSHGQATTERGFSVHGKPLVENTETLFSQRDPPSPSHDLQAHDVDIAC